MNRKYERTEVGKDNDKEKEVEKRKNTKLDESAQLDGRQKQAK